MKFFAFAALILAVFQAGVWAATTPEEPPTCGLLCIQQETLKSTCELTNVTCICTNVELNEKISLCVHANCTVRESLLVQSYSKHTCNAPSRDRTALVWILGIVFLVIGLVGFGLRVMARVFVRAQTWGADDWVMLLAVLMMIPLNAISIPISRVGLGKDIWNVHPDDITDFLYFFFWDELLYLGVLPVTKISILLFYLKVFPGKNIRLGCWILIGLNVAYFIAFELVSIFQCTPIEGAWRAWDKEFPAKCNNINMQGWMAAILNIVLDVATLCLPLWELYKLSLSRKKKIQIMLMFSVGFFVTIVSIVRLQSLASYATTSNVTQDYVEIGYWSTIEVPVSILCACMPAIRSLFSLVFPKVFGTTARSKSEYANISEGKQASSSQKSTSKALSQGQGVRVSKNPNETSAMELTDMRFDYHHHHGRHSSEKLPVTPREPV
ncbi:CFEM domain-containing protein [Fusarium keratoplasticum]|uniref:CFEM domain-containing protein n=1 Tax=Fusarium keratoplasticum TaxID=1328300 RepID=A0ACC0R0D5_9HYPO|nr:CFEM domain-containing protein [Fusarium keratoplasticum]KAI8669647.1 CFEM domain-containing protein [Fusarium keratoplasticum]KAI8674239.1 CFEM domain-containing protein [Fusarium keratoplasticum]